MKEITGNIWDYLGEKDVVLCITTNGYVKGNGAAVMGRGVALQAKSHFPGIEYELGKLIKDHGNLVQFLTGAMTAAVIAFPVKHRWREPADH